MIAFRRQVSRRRNRTPPVSLGTRPAQVAKGFDLRVRPCTLDALARHHRGFDDELRTQSMDCRRALLGK